MKQRRQLIGMTQEHLAERLGLTFQQVQKYEAGSNKIGAGRLFEIAQILKVPVQYFYESGDQPIASDTIVHSASVSASVLELITPAEAKNLMRAFAEISSPIQRRALIEMARSMTSTRKTHR